MNVSIIIIADVNGVDDSGVTSSYPAVWTFEGPPMQWLSTCADIRITGHFPNRIHEIDLGDDKGYFRQILPPFAEDVSEEAEICLAKRAKGLVRRLLTPLAEWVLDT